MRSKSSKLKPKIHYDDIEYYLHGFEERQLENDKIFALMEKLTNLAFPTYEDQYDKRWEYFYLPIVRNRENIAIPVWIMEYNNGFFVTIQTLGRFHIIKGNKEVENFFSQIIKEILRFVPIVKRYPEILENIIPYDIRTGKIKGIHVLEDLLPQDKNKKILEDYEKHIEKNLQIIDEKISLNEYLNVASICYKAAYQKETEYFLPVQMYKKWADGRDGGMLSIKNWNDKNEFSEWLHSGIHIGSHPFEIVFSWHKHGIHLYPPDEEHYYKLRVTNLYYAEDFLKMLISLIDKQIPIRSENLKEVLDYLAGNTYFTVNVRDDHYFMYIPTKEYKQKYFSHIIWDEIKIVKWKD